MNLKSFVNEEIQPYLARPRTNCMFSTLPFRPNVLFSAQISLFRAKCVYFGPNVLISGQMSLLRAKCSYFGSNVLIRAKCPYFGPNILLSDQMSLFRTKCPYFIEKYLKFIPRNEFKEFESLAPFFWFRTTFFFGIQFKSQGQSNHFGIAKSLETWTFSSFEGWRGGQRIWPGMNLGIFPWNTDAVSEIMCLVLILHLFSLQCMCVVSSLRSFLKFVPQVLRKFQSFPTETTPEKRNMEALEGTSLNSFFVERGKNWWTNYEI